MHFCVKALLEQKGRLTSAFHSIRDNRPLPKKIKVIEKLTSLAGRG